MQGGADVTLLWPRWQRAVAAPLLLAGLALGVAAQAGVEEAAAFVMNLWASAALGFGVGVLAFGLRLQRPLGTGWPHALCMAALLGGTVFAIHWLGMRQFGGFDHSMVIDAGWRMLQGQRPPLDFANTTPPGFLLGPWWAFQTMGVSWQSLVDTFALFALGITAWSMLLWRALLGRPWMALGLSAVPAAMAFVSVSFWWYNPLTSAAGIVFALSTAMVLSRPQAGLAWVSWIAAAVLLGCAKPNVAGLLAVPAVVLLLSRPGYRRAGLFAAVTAAAALEGLLRLSGLRFFDFASGYSEVAAAGLKLGQFFVDPHSFAVAAAVAGLALMLLPLPALWRRMQDPRMALLGAATVAAGLIAFISTGELKVVDLALLFTGIVLSGLSAGVLPALDTGTDRTALLGRYLILMAVVGSSIGLGAGFTRQRVLGIGYGSFFEHELWPEPFTDGFFRGLRAGPHLFEVHQEVARALDGRPPGPVYFGPRMQWAHAAFAQASPVGQPLWWHPGISMALSRQEAFLAALTDGHFGLMVFLQNDYTYLPPGFEARLLRLYERLPGFATLDVYRRRPAL